MKFLAPRILRLKQEKKPRVGAYNAFQHSKSVYTKDSSTRGNQKRTQSILRDRKQGMGVTETASIR